jgi:hypothetical protein
MRSAYTKEFFLTYNLAFRKYVNGDWTKAKELFEKTLEIAPKPGNEPVTLKLLAFMSET